MPSRAAPGGRAGGRPAAGASGRRSGHPWRRGAHSCRRPGPRRPCRRSCAAWGGARAWLALPAGHGRAAGGGGEASPGALRASGGAGRASGRAWRRPGTAGAAGQQPRVKAGLHSRSHLTASPLQAEAINALRGWDARLHPFLDDKPREGMRGKKNPNKQQKLLLQFSGRFSHFLADPDTSHRHPAEAHLYVQALQAKCFLVEIASRQSTEKDTPLPMIRTDAGALFSLHA